MPIFGNHIIWVIILVIVLIIFGPGKLPQIGSAIGGALKEFRKATTELRDEVAKATEHQAAEHPDPPAAPVTTAHVESKEPSPAPKA